MNNLTKAYLKATLYFYTIMTVPFALAWGLVLAGADLPTLLGPTLGDVSGPGADCLILFLGVLPGAFLLRKKMKANAEAIKAANEAPPFSARSLQALFLSTVLTGVLGFGLFLALAMVFLPYTSQLTPFTGAGPILGLDQRMELLHTVLPICLGAGAAFGAFMWGASQKNLVVRAVTWAAFIACVFFNPFTLFVEPAPPTLMQQVAQDIKMSPPLERALEEFGVDEQDLQPQPEQGQGAPGE